MIALWRRRFFMMFMKSLNTLQARLYIDIRDNENSIFKQTSKRPSRFFLKNLQCEDGVDVEVVENEPTGYNERDLHKRFSWATVELYYSLYYLIRASMASKGIAMLRCKSMYRLFARTGEKPFSTGNKKYNTTHEGTISHYKDLFGQSDILLSNNIEEQDVYQWMMNAREIVNYRSAVFPEPDCLDIWDYFSQSIDEGNFTNVLEQLENDPYIMCFQEEYAVIAIPIKRLQQTISDMLNASLLSDFNEERLRFIKNVIGYEERNLHIMPQIF